MSKFGQLLSCVFLLGAVALPPAGGAASVALDGNKAADIEARVNDLMSRLTPEEMADLLATNYWTTNEIPRLGIPKLQMVNGSFGPVHHHSTGFPLGVNLAATFNRDLVREVGAAIGKEARSKGDNTLLGPVIYMHRIPQGGRNAESYSEDPYLAGQIAVEHIRGVQSQGVITTAALFGCKSHEYHSAIYDVKADPRTIHEIYLPAYKAAVQEGGTWSLMTAYNRVNGAFVSNHTYLLTDIVKERWGFKGFIMTDWAGVQNFQEALYAGLDLDMSDARSFNRERMLPVLRGDRGPMYREKARDKVRRLLRGMLAMGFFERKDEKIEVDLAKHQDLALRTARESIVLLKNNGNLLPLDRRRLKSIAVIGPNAAIARMSIAGASRLSPYRTVSPLEGIRAAAGGDVRIVYAKGCNVKDRGFLLDRQHVKAPDGQPGFQIEYFDNRDLKGKPTATAHIPEINFMWMMDKPDPALKSASGYSARIRGLFTPPQSGRYDFTLAQGKSPVRYTFGERTSASAEKSQGWIAEWVTEVNDLRFQAGKPVPVELEVKSTATGANNLELRWNHFEEDPLPAAVKAARECDVALIFAGFNDSIEGEEFDRTPNLPKEQEELIRAVAAVNKNVVVILNAGSAVVMDKWEPGVPALMHAFYPGQEGGTAIADILFGTVNPSGRLPATIMRHWEDSPAYGTYPQKEDELVHFKEGIYVGYRWFDRPDAKPALFTFGHGLSYTTFRYEDLSISPKVIHPGESVKVGLKVRNTGSREGAEVVQLYVGDDEASVDRPVRELKGFTKVFLKPGEVKAVELTIPPDALKFFEIRIDDWKAEPGTFTVSVGASSQDLRLKGRFELTQ